MSTVLFEQLEACFKAPVQEGYGQSEASSIITSNPLNGPRKPGSIGLPLPGVTLEVVDEEDNSVAPFGIGEIRIQGPIVMLGYWQHPEATQKALKNQWLYTSDLAYRDDDGYIFLVNRKDDLINVGGNKVYPRDIEELLVKHPAIAQCAIAGEACPLYGESVSAYVVLKTGHTLTTLELQHYCTPHLARYKIPTMLYVVDELPLGPTGKLLRRQLAKVTT